MYNRNEKVWEYAMDAGFTPLEDRCIIVKGAAGDLSEKIVCFFETWDMAVLQMCENELILLPFESFWGTLERDVSLVIPYADIESVKLIDDLLNVVIDIETTTGGVRLTTHRLSQQGHRPHSTLDFGRRSCPILHEISSYERVKGDVAGHPAKPASSGVL